MSRPDNKKEDQKHTKPVGTLSVIDPEPGEIEDLKQKWSLKRGYAAWVKHVKTGWNEMVEAGSWKTPLKVFLVTCLAIGVGVAIALLVLHYA